MTHHYKKRGRLLILITVIITGLSILYYQYIINRTEQNGFNRKVIYGNIKLIKTIDLQYNSYYFAGATYSNLYLANYISPANMFLIQLQNWHTKQIYLSNLSNYKLKTIQLTIDSPNCLVQDPATATLLRANLKDWQFTEAFDKKFNFTNAIGLSRSTYIIKRIKPKILESELAKVTGATLSANENLLEKQIDGIFCTDGMLRYDNIAKKFIYVYYYRNEYFTCDTNLNLLYRGRTIDTNKYAKLKVGFVKSSNSLTLASPPFFINKKSSVSNNYLFIYSALKADNDNNVEFNNSPVLDMYNLNSGSYIESMFLQGIAKEKIQDFMIVENLLIVIHDHYVSIFKLMFL